MTVFMVKCSVMSPPLSEGLCASAGAVTRTSRPDRPIGQVSAEPVRRTRLDSARRSQRGPDSRLADERTQMTEYAVTDPRTGERISDVPTDSDEQVLAGVAAAQDAFTSWGRTSSVADRAKLVRRVSELHT